jgi:hypothetical protein
VSLCPRQAAGASGLVAGAVAEHGEQEVDWLVPDHALWRVELTLAADGAESELLFVHRLSEPEALGDAGPGWQYYLDRLGASLAGGPMPDWGDYYPALRDVYEQG